MTHKWQDASGATPEDHDGEWTWDEQALVTGEYVGYKLYLLLRDRLTTLTVPAEAHNLIILEMIHCHDTSLVDDGVGCSTLLYRARDDQERVELEVLGPDDIGPWDGTAGPQTFFEK